MKIRSKKVIEAYQFTVEKDRPEVFGDFIKTSKSVLKKFGKKYQVKLNSKVIPVDSILVNEGDYFVEISGVITILSPEELAEHYELLDEPAETEESAEKTEKEQ